MKARIKKNIPLRFRTLLRKLYDNSVRQKQRIYIKVLSLWWRFSGVTSRHLVISGCSRSGSTLLYSMLRHSVGASVCMPARELPALQTQTLKCSKIITKRPLDIFELEAIDETIGKFRDVLHLILLRDPRDLVSSRHEYVSNQYFQGYDYQFLIRDGFKSFTGPGLGAIAEAVRKVKNDNRRIYTMRYEELVCDPERARQVIGFATGFELRNSFSTFHESKIPQDLVDALNGVRPVEAPKKPAWTESGRYERVLRQISTFPELESLALEWGYPALQDVQANYSLPKTLPKAKQGIIVAFHTDDDFYKAEAKRCRKRLDILGLPYEMIAIAKSKDWVANCAMKSKVLLDFRRKLRGPLLYIDVDAFVHENPWPYLADYDGDLATYVQSDGELLSGTILINDTQAAKSLLEEWYQLQKGEPQTWDQRVLQHIVENDENFTKRYNFQRLSSNFCHISDRVSGCTYGNPIIEHLQASRVLKRGGRGAAMERRIQVLERGNELE